jgi:hypothetical protein
MPRRFPSRSLRLALAAGALLAFARGAHSDEGAAPPTPPVVHLVWTDPQEALRFSPRQVAAELERPLADMGLRMSWSAVAPDAVSGPTDVRIVLLATERSQQGRLVLGVTDPGPPPVVWLMLGSIRRALGLDPAASPTSAEVRPLSRAMSRVIVHELVHAVAPQHPHSSAGLMSLRVSRATLLGQGVQLDPPAREALLTGLLARGVSPFPRGARSSW